MRPLVVGAYLESAHRTRRGLLKDEGDVEARQPLALAPGPFVFSEARGQIHEVEELLFREVGLFQQTAPAQLCPDLCLDRRHYLEPVL